MPSHGTLTLFFRWRKKSVQKKASGTATPEAARPASHCGQALRYACAWLRASWPPAISGASRPSASLGGGLRPAVAPSGLSSSSVRFAHPPGKSPLLPILTAGLVMSRASELARLCLPSCALGARLFPPSKWAGLFPSAAYRRSASSQLAWGRLTPCGVGCFGVVGRFCGVNKRADFLCPVGGGQAYPLRVEVLQCSSYFFAAQKASGISNPRWPLLRAMRPVAKWRSMLYNRQGAAPDRRAARPIAERR